MKTSDDVQSLIDLANRVIADLQSFDTGVAYDKLQIAAKFGALVTPLITGDDLCNELRQSVPPVELFQLKRNVFELKNANMFQSGKGRQQYGGAVIAIRTALEQHQKNISLPKKNETGPWTVFYSWQSTLPGATNRGLIRTCIDKAVLALNKEMDVKDSHRVDSDTSGRPGAPKIFDTILEKIRTCDVFVADVSLVADKQSNSNVMVELGYALSTLGPNAIVMVCNTAYGSIQDLPFDLGFSRVIPYSCSEGQEDKATIRNDLIPKLKAAIDAICRPT